MISRKSAPYMKTWISEEVADTAGWTQAQVGAYWLLKMAMWRAGGKLPAADDRLADIARCSLAEWTEMKGRVLSVFQRRGGIIRQERLSEAISDYQDSFCARSKGGKTTAAKNRNKNNENAEHSAPAQSALSRHNKKKNQKEERASNKALSSDGIAVPPEIRAAISAERGEGFCVSFVDRSTWRGDAIRPWSGPAMIELVKLKCLAEMGVSVLLADGEKAA